jgi:hypothetical protein
MMRILSHIEHAVGVGGGGYRTRETNLNISAQIILGEIPSEGYEFGYLSVNQFICVDMRLYMEYSNWSPVWLQGIICYL